MADYKLGIIGLGRMGSEILEAILNNKLLQSGEILAFDTNPRCCELVASHGVPIAANNVRVTQACSLVLLAVNPQMAEDVLLEIQAHAANTCFISVMTGISSGYIKSKLPDTTYVIPVLPNTPLIVGKAATVISKPVDVPLDFYRAVVSIFSCVGDVVFLDEADINTVIPLSSSSPAFFFRMASDMVRYAEDAGLDPVIALRLVAQAMEGAAVMLKETGKSPEELIAQVSSPGGTTVAALNQLDIHGFDEALQHAMVACKLRADELSRG